MFLTLWIYILNYSWLINRIYETVNRTIKVPLYSSGLNNKIIDLDRIVNHDCTKSV